MYNICTKNIRKLYITKKAHMIVVVGGVKGGTGKTTIATNLAVLRAASRKKVLLVDADEQKSTTIWVNQRHMMDIPTKWATIQLAGKAVYSEVEKMKVDYDDIIIDVGGRETQSLRAAIGVADIFIIPFKPRSLDMWTLENVELVISEMKQANPNLVCVAVVNQADVRGPDNEQTLQILNKCEDIECFPNVICMRKSFATASGDGLGVSEMEFIDKKAVQEITDLYEFIYNKCTITV